MAYKGYESYSSVIPGAIQIAKDEDKHERKLFNLIEEKSLNYIGSVVFGLNVALVELTGTLDGLTFALQDNRIIGVVGLIKGLAASMTMA